MVRDRGEQTNGKKKKKKVRKGSGLTFPGIYAARSSAGINALCY